MVDKGNEAADYLRKGFLTANIMIGLDELHKGYELLMQYLQRYRFRGVGRQSVPARSIIQSWTGKDHKTVCFKRRSRFKSNIVFEF